MGAHEVIELRLPGEPVVTERIDDEGNLEGTERLGRDLPLPSGQTIRIRILEEQPSPADDNGIGGGVDPGTAASSTSRRSAAAEANVKFGSPLTPSVPPRTRKASLTTGKRALSPKLPQVGMSKWKSLRLRIGQD